MSAGPQSKEPSNAITVLLFGAASGYLGGTVLQTLLDLIRDNAGKCGGEDQPPEYRVSLFARAVNSSLYSKLPVNIIEGNYSELGLIESSAAAHDVVRLSLFEPGLSEKLWHR